MHIHHTPWCYQTSGLNCWFTHISPKHAENPGVLAAVVEISHCGLGSKPNCCDWTLSAKIHAHVHCAITRNYCTSLKPTANCNMTPSTIRKDTLEPRVDFQLDTTSILRLSIRQCRMSQQLRHSSHSWKQQTFVTHRFTKKHCRSRTVNALFVQPSTRNNS